VLAAKAAAKTEAGSQIDFTAFAQEWNRTADGIYRFYVTAEVLSAYAKTWEKSKNIHATQDLISADVKILARTAAVFAGEERHFPTVIGGVDHDHPLAGLLDVEMTSTTIPPSISTDLPTSNPPMLPLIHVSGHETHPVPSDPHVNTLQVNYNTATLEPQTQMGSVADATAGEFNMDFMTFDFDPLGPPFANTSGSSIMASSSERQNMSHSTQ
jgi:hypothetical protein